MSSCFCSYSGKEGRRKWSDIIIIQQRRETERERQRVSERQGETQVWQRERRIISLISYSTRGGQFNWLVYPIVVYQYLKIMLKSLNFPGQTLTRFLINATSLLSGKTVGESKQWEDWRNIGSTGERGRESGGRGKREGRKRIIIVIMYFLFF